MTDTELPEFIEQDLLVDMKDVEVPDQAFLKCFVQAKNRSSLNRPSQR